MDPVPTERLWLTEPRRSTALARVVAVRGRAFALDRSLFAPKSLSHRHPQPHDQGTVWWEGEKRRLERVFERDGSLWHLLRGTVPARGAELNIHLDADRRMLASRAHTAMHLLLKALAISGAPPLVADPEVKGGGNIRMELAASVAPRALAEALAQANRWAEGSHAVRREFVPRGAEVGLDAQRFQPPDPFPGPADVLAVVRIDGVCAYPCDGTHVERTAQVGRIVVAEARARAGGAFTLVAKVR
ncbi:MAG: hypothetical protein LC620_00335 [Halobacteriales archaeon]|nr:hypothetical protein [Halobacteriales archaeon]